ncbi:fimbrial protein [Aeromonas finlandensis]|uniref:fimbrial protein n=1 Tax=Aeromonas finlandensis TaxID=1543375 RepID=UPI00051C349E|nr:fimbrial protein [Aeromonas finlandensis]
MIKHVLSTAIMFSLSVASMSSHAAQINFTGSVTSQSCELSAGDLDFTLSTVGESDVLEAGKQAGMITLSTAVTCEGASSGTVNMSLMPKAGSFEGKVLKNTADNNAAKGVGFVVMNDKMEILDFSNGNAEISAPIDGKGVANILISANYAKDGSGEDVEAGMVKAVLPFVLTYE